jgi:cobalt-zinc-cadmium efflux system protein
VSGSHDHSREASRKRLAVVLGLTTVYLIAEVVGGLMTHSLALLADAGHMLTDVAGLGLALFAMSFAGRPATPERTYGYHRVEILAALINSVVLVGISLFVLYEAWERLRNPPPVSSGAMIAVAVVGLIVNLVGVSILKGGASASLNVQGAYFEVLSDLFASIGVIVAGVVMWTTGWYYADPIISAAIGLFILPRTFKLMGQAVGVLLEGTPADVNLAVVRTRLEQVPGVDALHDLHVWTLTSGMNAMSLHVVLADGATHDDVLAGVQQAVTAELDIAHVTVQVERKGCAALETHL